MKNIFTFLMILFCATLIAQTDQVFIHTATAENSSGNVTYLDHPDINNNPNAPIVYAHVWNPGGVGGVYNNNVTGLWYNSGNGQWAIFNESIEDIVEGSSYNVYISNSENVITHISTSGNEGTFGAHTTVIDNIMMEGNPGPYAVMSNYWNPNSVYNNQSYGFYFDVDLNKRGIYQEGGMAIPEGSAFKILVNGSGTGVERFTHVVTKENIFNNYTVIDHASINENPEATFVFSHYWGLEGASSQVDLDQVLGLWYNGLNWAIYREDASGQIPVGMAFDIIVAPQKIVSVEDITPEVNVSVSPNPTTNFVTISTKEAISSITLYNNTGREVLYLAGVGNTMKVDLSDYSLGIYLAKVRVGDAEKTIKLIKQ